MRRALDFLGITREKGSPRPKVLTAIIGAVGLSLVIFGGAVIAGNLETGSPRSIWVGGVLIVIGLACWLIEAVLVTRSAGGGPSR